MKRPHDAQQKSFETIDVRDDDDDDDEEEDDADDESDENKHGDAVTTLQETSTLKQPVAQQPETPVKLYLTDVESVFGVSKK